MDNTIQLITDIFKQEVANQVESKVINMANVKILKAQLEMKNKEAEQLKNEVECLKSEMDSLREELAQYRAEQNQQNQPVEVVEAEAVEVE